MSTISWGFPNQQAVTDQQVGGLLQYKEVSFTSAQILNMHNSVDLIFDYAAPNMYYNIEKVYWEFTPGATPYTVPADTYFTLYNSQHQFDATILGVPSLASGVSTNSGNFVIPADNTAVANWYYLTNLPNYGSPVYIGLNNAVTLGNGTLKLKIYYQIVQFG